jgi:hypothetical protein
MVNIAHNSILDYSSSHSSGTIAHVRDNNLVDRNGKTEHKRLRRYDIIVPISASFTVDFGVNLISSDIGYRGLAVALAVTTILSGAWWVHRIPARAPVRKQVPRALLVSAGAPTLAILFVHKPWSGWLTLIAASLVCLAVLIPTDKFVALRLLNIAAMVGSGALLLGHGIQHFRIASPWPGTIGIALGLANLLSGLFSYRKATFPFDLHKSFSVTRGGRLIAGTLMPVQVAFTYLLGAVLFLNGLRLEGIAVWSAGLSILICARAIRQQSYSGLTLSMILLGSSISTCGAALLVDSLSGFSDHFGQIANGLTTPLAATIISSGIVHLLYGLWLFSRTSFHLSIKRWIFRMTHDPDDVAPH